MKNIIVVFFNVYVFFSVSAQKKGNVLANTRWTFVGLIYNTTGVLHPCTNNVSYTIDFLPHNRLNGVATVRHRGKYKIKKKEYIKIRTFIPKGTLPGQNDQAEFECRLNYSKYLSTDAKFVLQGDELRIFSNQYVTMVFRAIN